MKTTLLLLMVMSPVVLFAQSEDGAVTKGDQKTESSFSPTEAKTTVDEKVEPTVTPVTTVPEKNNTKTGVVVTNSKPNNVQNEPTTKIVQSEPVNNTVRQTPPKTSEPVNRNTNVDQKIPDQKINIQSGQVNDINTGNTGPVTVNNDPGNSESDRREKQPVQVNNPVQETGNDDGKVTIPPVQTNPKNHSDPMPYVPTNTTTTVYTPTTNTRTNTVVYRDRHYYSQTNNYYYDQITPRYTKPESSFMLGVLTTTTKYPDRFNIEKAPVQSGFQIGSRYNIHKIEDISMGGIANLGINLLGSFNLGFASGTDNLKYNDAGIDYDYSTQHYTFVGDLFSLSANAEYKANVFADRGIVLGMTVTFFNLGGTVSYMKGGRFDEEVFGTINILPLYIQPYAKVKFLGGTLGAGLLLNPYNFAEYRFGPEGFYGESESGFHTNSSKINRYAIEAYFKF